MSVGPSAPLVCRVLGYDEAPSHVQQRKASGRRVLCQAINAKPLVTVSTPLPSLS